MKTKTTILTMLASAAIFISCEKEKFMDQPGNLVPKTVDQDATLPAIHVNGALLHAEAFGPADSTMIIMVHGGPGTDYGSLLNCKDLSNYGYRVVFYDQRGCGLSQRFPKQSYLDLRLAAVDQSYDDLSGVIAHYRTSPNQKVVLLGQSWGGILASGYVGKYPNAVQGLIVLEPGGLQWPDLIDYMKRARNFGLTSEQMNDVMYIDQFLTGDENQHEVLDYKMGITGAYNPVTGEDNRAPGSFWRCGAVVSEAFTEIGMEYEPDFSAGVENFTPTVCYFHSDGNQIHPYEWAQRISSAYSSVEIHTITGTGHTGMLDEDSIWQSQTLPTILAYMQAL